MREEQDSRAMEEILAEYVKREANNQKEIEELKRELVWYKSHSQQMEASLAFRVGMKLSNLNRRLGGGIVLKLLRKIKHKIKGNLENNIKSTSDNAQCLSTNYDNLLPLAEFEFYKYKEERERIYHISLENIEVPCKKDLVSVVLPVYNGGDLLKESIESVLRQSYENFEFIIVDDGSTDNTAEIIDYYAKMDNRIRAIHKENEKLPKTLSRGFKEARGEFFTWTSADNIMETDFLKKLVGELKKYPELGMVYANIKLIDAKGEFITTNQWYANPKRPEQVMFPKCILRLNTYADNYIGAAFMYRASVARVIGDYSANRYCIEDYDYWMRINNIFQLRHSDFNEAIYRYRFHSDSLTAKDKELKITENRYQEMLWESFRREYLLKPICWIIDGDYQNIEIFKAFKESIVKANHKLVLAEDLDTNKESGIYEKSIYVKFDGEQRIRTVSYTRR
ncbi:MAG: glycosyltransferase family 2 protein, partial [Anaeroplasmataceae bacterium]|nr:glycosyltransferase family 2 protein [Anaeroplasmataceae bacterium]